MFFVGMMKFVKLFKSVNDKVSCLFKTKGHTKLVKIGNLLKKKFQKILAVKISILIELRIICKTKLLKCLQ